MRIYPRFLRPIGPRRALSTSRFTTEGCACDRAPPPPRHPRPAGGEGATRQSARATWWPHGATAAGGPRVDTNRPVRAGRYLSARSHELILTRSTPQM
eukprot:1081921-Prorocentrum_minimum.AAC.1